MNSFGGCWMQTSMEVARIVMEFDANPCDTLVLTSIGTLACRCVVPMDRHGNHVAPSFDDHKKYHQHVLIAAISDDRGNHMIRSSSLAQPFDWECL